MSEQDELSNVLAPLQLPSDGRFEKYRAERLIGRGGMGIVVLALDLDLRRQVAIKIMKPDLARGESSRLMFLAEARAMAALNHENVISVFEVGQRNDLPFVVMEFLSGTSLAEMLRADYPLSDTQVAKIAIQVCNGIAAAHQSGIIHRDIKPANIFVEMPRGRVKLLDFGLARSVFEGNIPLAVLAGTPGYMSPEQARDEPVDSRTDLYSLGALFFRLLTGRLPLEDETVSGVLAQLLTRRAPPIQQLRPDLPPRLCALIDACLSPEIADRPRSVEMLQESFQLLLETQTGASPSALVHVEHDAPRNESVTPKRTRRWVWSLVATVVLLFAAVLIFERQRRSQVEQNAAVPPDPFNKPARDEPGRQEEVPIDTRKRPASNVPESLQDCILVRPEAGRGEDTYVRFGETSDYGQQASLTVSAERGAKSFAYVLFDLQERVPKNHRITHVYVLLTLLKNTPEESRDDQTWDCMVLREEAAKSRWLESGPQRITFEDSPAQVYAIDLAAAGTLRGSLSKWFEDDRVMLLQLRNKELAAAVTNDKDGLLTIMLRSRDTKAPKADFVSSEGPAGFGPCLAICVEPIEPR
ncbi:MAG: serine/threonine-protein kinase [Planctomycetota bacterium]